jgi:hypothetical protein
MYYRLLYYFEQFDCPQIDVLAVLNTGNYITFYNDVSFDVIASYNGRRNNSKYVLQYLPDFVLLLSSSLTFQSPPFSS